MSTTDITGHVLADIRDEIRGTNTRLDHAVTHLGIRLDHAMARLDTRLDVHERILLRIADQLGSVDARLDRLEDGQKLASGRLETLVGVVDRVIDRGQQLDEALADLRSRVGLLERVEP